MYPIYKTVREKTEGHVVKALIHDLVSKRTETILGGVGTVRAIAVGMVLGRRLFDDPVITPAGGNTGDGALGDLSLAAGAKVGDYVLTCIAAAADGGRFQVVDPDGYRLADALVGVAYAGPQLGFTIADGAADFAVGDTITVEVPEGDRKLVQLAPAATDGSQVAAAIATERLDVPVGQDVDTAPVVWGAILLASGLVWPDGISVDAKAAALAALAANHVTTLQGN